MGQQSATSRNTLTLTTGNWSVLPMFHFNCFIYIKSTDRRHRVRNRCPSLNEATSCAWQYQRGRQFFYSTCKRAELTLTVQHHHWSWRDPINSWFWRIKNRGRYHWSIFLSEERHTRLLPLVCSGIMCRRGSGFNQFWCLCIWYDSYRSKIYICVVNQTLLTFYYSPSLLPTNSPIHT